LYVKIQKSDIILLKMAGPAVQPAPQVMAVNDLMKYSLTVTAVIANYKNRY
jgi:hypothetical protein